MHKNLKDITKEKALANYLRNKAKRKYKNNNKKLSNNNNKPSLNNSQAEHTQTKIVTAANGEEREVVLKGKSNEEFSTTRITKGQLTYPALKVVGGEITESLNGQLNYPEAFYTYSDMLESSIVSSAIDMKKTLLWNALNKFQIETGDINSKKAKEASKFINWVFNNFDQTWYDIVNNLLSYNKWGFSAMEKVFTKVKTGEHKGKFKIKKLTPISPKSIDEWVFDNKHQELLGLKQTTAYLNISKSPTKFQGLRFNSLNKQPDIDVPRNKILLFSYRSELNNPVGVSPLADAFQPYQAMKLIQDYQLIGISKNLGGVVEVNLPAEVMMKANADPSSEEAAFVNQLAEDAANAHAGDQTYFMLPSDTFQGTQNKMYTLTLKGIEGSTNQQDLDNTILEYKKDILNAFGVGFILTGQTGGGSYGMRESQTNTHGLMLESDLAFIAEQFNTDLIPQLLALNGFKLTADEMPTFTAGDIEQENLETFSKAMQRLAATGLISKHPLVIRNVMKRAGIPRNILDRISDDELEKYLTEDVSRSGDGMSEGMPNGTGKNSGGRGNDTDNNNENKA